MKRLLILFSSILFASCATTKISSFINPDIDFSDYKKILVFANSRDIDFRKTLETDLVTAFTKQAISAVSSIEIISPVKEYTDEEIKKIISDNNIEGYLSVAVITSSEESAYIPQTSYTNYHTQYVNGQLVSVPYTSIYGGYSVSYPKASFEIVFTDIKTGQTVFKATANSKGDELSDMKTISKSLAKKIVEEYISLSKPNQEQ